jgi:hypothetical protein
MIIISQELLYLFPMLEFTMKKSNKIAVLRKKGSLYFCLKFLNADEWCGSFVSLSCFTVAHKGFPWISKGMGWGDTVQGFGPNFEEEDVFEQGN